MEYLRFSGKDELQGILNDLQEYIPFIALCEDGLYRLKIKVSRERYDKLMKAKEYISNNGFGPYRIFLENFIFWALKNLYGFIVDGVSDDYFETNDLIVDNIIFDESLVNALKKAKEIFKGQLALME